MIDALIKHVSVTYKCYEMYAHRGEKGATARVLRVIKFVSDLRQVGGFLQYMYSVFLQK